MNANSTVSVMVEGGGDQVVAHVGLHALGAFADRVNVGELLSARIAQRGLRPPLHDRGKVLVQAMLMLAGGGESCSDIERLRSQPRSSARWRRTRLFSGTIDGHAGVHFTTSANPQGISGVGSTTGDTYHGTGVTVSQFNATVGETSTFVNNFRIIGTGPGNNFVVHEVFHVTVNANGDVTAFVDNFSIDCT